MKIISASLLLPLITIKSISADPALRGSDSFRSLEDAGEVTVAKTNENLNGTGFAPMPVEVPSTPVVARRELSWGSNVFENAQRAVVQKDADYAEFELWHTLDFCNPTGGVVKSKYVGTVDANDGYIIWNEIWTNDQRCATRSGSSADFVRLYLGTVDLPGTRLVPTAVILPHNVNMRKFSLSHTNPSVCGAGSVSVTTWYGEPCGNDNIQWNYMQTDIQGSASTCCTNPQHRIWTRWSTNTAHYLVIVKTKRQELPSHFDTISTLTPSIIIKSLLSAGDPDNPL